MGHLISAEPQMPSASAALYYRGPFIKLHQSCHAFSRKDKFTGHSNQSQRLVCNLRASALYFFNRLACELYPFVMLKLTGKGSITTCDGLTRRDFLQAGTLGAIGLTLSRFSALK